MMENEVALLAKKCTRCKELLTVKHFSRDRTNSDNLQGACKACAYLYVKEWRERNRKHANAWDRDYKKKRRALGLVKSKKRL